MEDLAIITALLVQVLFASIIYYIRFAIKIKMLFTSLGQSIMKRTVPSVLRTTEARIETFGTVFPNTNLLAGE